MKTTQKELQEMKYKDESPYFEQQPPGTRVATWNDFTKDGKIILNLPYLIHSEQIPGRFWAFRSKPGFEHANDFDIFLERGRVLVFEK